MRFHVTINNLEGRVIILFGRACFHEAGAELVFSVPRVIVIAEDTYTAHNNKAALSGAAHKSFFFGWARLWSALFKKIQKFYLRMRWHESMTKSCCSRWLLLKQKATKKWRYRFQCFNVTLPLFTLSLNYDVRWIRKSGGKKSFYHIKVDAFTPWTFYWLSCREKIKK